MASPMLKKLSMPKSKPEEPMFDMSEEEMSSELAPEEGSPAEEAAESPEEELKELEKVDDELLQKALEARGYKVSKPEEAPKDEMAALEGEPMEAADDAEASY